MNLYHVLTLLVIFSISFEIDAGKPAGVLVSFGYGQQNHLEIRSVSSSSGNVTVKKLQDLGVYYFMSSAVDAVHGQVLSSLIVPQSQTFAIALYNAKSNKVVTKKNVGLNNLQLIRWSAKLGKYFALGYTAAGQKTLHLFSIDPAASKITDVGDTSSTINYGQQAAVNPVRQTLVTILNQSVATSIALSSAQVVKNLTLWQAGVISLCWDDVMNSLIGLVWYGPGKTYYLAKIDETTGSVGFYVGVTVPGKASSINYASYSSAIRSLFVVVTTGNKVSWATVNIDTGAFTLFSAASVPTMLPDFVPFV